MHSIWRASLSDEVSTEKREAKIINSTFNESEADFSPDGHKIVFRTKRSGEDQIWICDQNGKHAYPTIFTGGVPRWSPDSRKIAINDILDMNKDIYIIDLDNGQKKRITYHKANDSVPSWSKDGQWIYFRSGRGEIVQIWKTPVAGGQAVQVTQNGGFVACESADEKWVYFSKPRKSGIWKVPVSGGDEILVTDYPNHWRNWILFKERIYFMQRITNGFNIEYFDLNTKMVKNCLVENGFPRNNISISADGKNIIYTKRDVQESDIYLIDGLEF
jgi:Tol biopolymer transport system component